MKRVDLHKVTARGSGTSIDERYIVEMFDDVRSDAQPVALGYALFQPHDGMCCVNVVSRGVHDDGHARAALIALQAFVAGARAHCEASTFSVRLADDALALTVLGMVTPARPNVDRSTIGAARPSASVCK